MIGKTDGNVQKIVGINKISSVLADGTERFYYYDRKSGKRLKGEPGSLLFENSLREIRRQPPKRRHPAKDCDESGFGILIAKFEDTKIYKGWVETTRLAHETRFERIRDYFKEWSLKDLSDQRIRAEFYEFQDSLADTPSEADASIALISQLLTWADDRGHVSSNRAYRIKRLSKKGTRASITFKPRHHALVKLHAHPELCRLYFFCLLTCCRAGDARKMRWEHFDGKWLVFTPTKTAKKTAREVHLPVYLIKEILETMGPRRESGYIFTYNGRQWNARTLKQKWLDFRKLWMPDELGKTHWHDGRGSGSQLLGDSSCTTFEVGSITGHKVVTRDESDSIGNYVAASRRAARRAFKKLRVSIAAGCLVDEFWDEDDDDE